MRRNQKNDLMEMVQTLHQAHDEIKSYIENNSILVAQDLLGQCQECAITMGTNIETLEGEGFVTVSYIEEYCDVVFQIHEELSTQSSVNPNKIIKKLKKQLLKIENSIKNDVPEKKEVVFFPYKASMWDSLESVYLAAKEDPNCNAYCVPIPYYDRNPDGSLGQMHYEGNEYPKNIEVIDWQTYNFEERKPDVIYIHNPYDDWNLVTCVHPRYFSANLKKFTEKLVYIPYFVLGEIEPDDQETIDKMKHFVWTPGVINADKVIVQSEKMKQIYVNEYMKAAQANGLQGNHIDRKYLEEKFLGLGSPKFDKVQNTKKEDLEIPEEWLKIIEKPDGSWKKIIFYNTSIAALLEHNEKMLEKMKDVFKTFKENQDEVALLWRPHPLIKTTVSSMRPQLWVKYEKLVNQYKQEDWGIYDDTTDMDRAVVLSDAYYGDSSSVVQVYQKTGKPVMIQNVNVNSKCDHDYYLLNSWLKEEDDIYFVPHNLNVLVKYSVINKKSEWILPIPKTNQEKSTLYYDIKKYKNKLFLIPLHDNKIAIYDLKEDRFELVAIPYSEYWNCAWGNFSKAYSYEHSLYLVGYRYPGIIRLDMQTYKCEQVLDIHNENLENCCIALESVEKDGKIYILIQGTNELVRYDMKHNESISYHLLDDSTETYKTIAFDGEYFWFTANGVEYLKWDEKKQQGEIFIYPEQEKIPKDNLYRYSFFCEGKLYVLSSKEAPIVVIDCNDPDQSRLIWKDKNQMKGYCADYLYRNNQECTFIDLENQTNKILDATNGKIVDLKCIKDKERIIQMLFTYKENTAVKECGISLVEFINMLK